MALHIGLCQTVVFFADARQVFFCKAQRAVFHDDRLNRKNVETFIDHREHVVRKVHIVVRVGAAQIRIDAAVIPVTALAARDAFLEILHDAVVRAVAAGIGAHGIVDFLAAVKREHEGKVIVIEPFDVLIIQQHAVCRHRQLEFLPVSFSRWRAYSVTALTVFIFMSGSPPKKSTSQCLRGPQLSMRKSMARLPTSGVMTARS